MARFAQTLSVLKEIHGHMPAMLAASSIRPAAKGSHEDLVKQLISVLRKEDNDAVTIALLCDQLIKKFGGRSV